METLPSFVAFSDVALRMTSSICDEEEVVFGMDSCSGISPYGPYSPIRCISLRKCLNSSEMRYFATDKLWIVLEGSLSVTDLFGTVAECSPQQGFQFQVCDGCAVKLSASSDVLLLDVSLFGSTLSAGDVFLAKQVPQCKTVPNDLMSRYVTDTMEIVYFKMNGCWKGNMESSTSASQRVVLRVLSGSFVLRRRDIESAALTLVDNDVVIGGLSMVNDIHLATDVGGSLVVLFLFEHSISERRDHAMEPSRYADGFAAKSMHVME